MWKAEILVVLLWRDYTSYSLHVPLLFLFYEHLLSVLPVLHNMNESVHLNFALHLIKLGTN